MSSFFCGKNKSAGRFAVCEDFWRLNHLKCEAPESLQAKREPNPSGANWKSAESVLSEFSENSIFGLIIKILVFMFIYAVNY